MDDGVKLHGQYEISAHLHTFFKSLFGCSSSPRLSFNWEEVYGSSKLDFSDLDEKFSLEKIKIVVFAFGYLKAPGLDGFTFIFFKMFWNLISNDLYLF